MNYLVPLSVAALIATAAPAAAQCPGQVTVFEPQSGKHGFRMEVWAPAEGERGHALVYRPFHSTPERVVVVFLESADGANRYLLVGSRGPQYIEIRTDGSATMDASREYPSRWQALPCGDGGSGNQRLKRTPSLPLHAISIGADLTDRSVRRG